MSTETATEIEALVGRKSRTAFRQAQDHIPGGVNSPVRAWSRLGGQPAVIAEAAGSQITDVDGRRYIDYVLNDISVQMPSKVVRHPNHSWCLV